MTSVALPLTARQREMYRFGFVLFLLAEGIIFLTVFSIRFLLAGVGHSPELSQLTGASLTLLMGLSIVPAGKALGAARRDDREVLVRSLILTAWIGVLVVAALVVEWVTLDLPAGSRFGGIFLTAFAAHAAHMVAAILVLAGLAIQIRGGLKPSNSFAVEGGILFWLFMVGVWVALWTVFYVL